MPSYIRIAYPSGRLLLLPDGHIATGECSCPDEILVGYLVIRPIPGTAPKPHFWCICYDVHVTEGSAELGAYTVQENGTAAFPLTVKPPAKLSIGLWWSRSHSPYPGQSDMQVWCLGKYCGWFKMNKAGYGGASAQPARYVASVVVDASGEVSVSTTGSGSPFPIDPS